MDPIYELLAPYFDEAAGNTDLPSRRPLAPPAVDDVQTINYLNRLNKLSLADLTSTEPTTLAQSAQSHIRSLQALSKRSHQAVIACTTHTSNFGSLLPTVEDQAQVLQRDLPELESTASAFAQKYDRSTENAVLDRRKQALLLSRNMDRTIDVLDLPALLSSTVAAAQTASSATTSITAASYASALDLQAHIKRLHALYPRLGLISSISKQAEAEMENLASILITSLQSPTLKLAGAVRTIGWLRRVAPDLADDGYRVKPSTSITGPFDVTADTTGSSDGALGSLFLMCRLHTLNVTLNALEPLRDLADQETTRRSNGTHSKLLKQQVSASALGSQSERYLKRYIEIFREQSFSIVSMYKSIFPNDLPTTTKTDGGDVVDGDAASTTTSEPLLPLPSPVSSFSLHLVDMLAAVLREYMPNIADKQARESLLTQVLYCAGSLSRLGAEFGMLIALLAEDMANGLPGDDGDSGEGSNGDNSKVVNNHQAEDAEWIQVMQKHRVQASRLKVLARGVNSSSNSNSHSHSHIRTNSHSNPGRKGSSDAVSPA